MPRVSNPEDSIIPEEYVTNPERFVRNITKLASIVLHQHYPFVRDKTMQEDLIQEAICKAIDLCKAGTFDSSRSSIRNYLYTGMRNQMQNLLSKWKREISVEEVRPVDEDIEEPAISSNDITIDEDLIYEICDPFYALGNYHNNLIRALCDMGFIGDMTDLDEVSEPSDFILQSMIIEYLWRVSRNYDRY